MTSSPQSDSGQLYHTVTHCGLSHSESGAAKGKGDSGIITFPTGNSWQATGTGALCDAEALRSPHSPGPRDTPETRPAEVALKGHASSGGPVSKWEGSALLVPAGEFRKHTETCTARGRS